MPETSFNFISFFPAHIKRPGSGLLKFALFLCFFVILVGLLMGKTLLAAVGPVGVALSYLLLRVGSKSEQVVNIPAECQLRLRADILSVTYPNLDLRDGKGPRMEQWIFPLSEIKAVHSSLSRQFFRFEGSGERTVQFLANDRSKTQAVSFMIVHVMDLSAFHSIQSALLSRLPDRVLCEK